MGEVSTHHAPNALIIGTGEYVTGYVIGSGGSKSDKSCGVVGLVHFDLRRRGLLGDRILVAGTNGTKFPAVRLHWQKLIEGRYRELSADCETFPNDETSRDLEAYRNAMKQLRKGKNITRLQMRAK